MSVNRRTATWNLFVLYINNNLFYIIIKNFQIETHNFKFAKHVSDDRHPSSVVNTSEPLVGVI